jgi:hypothetical protein
MKLVIAHLVLYPQKDKYRRSHTNRQTRNIDPGKTFIAKQVPVGYLDKISKHSRWINR